MSSRNRYRNPPTPSGYMKREVGTVLNYDSEEEETFMDNLCDKIKATGILQGPELSIYKPQIITVPFSFNPSSEEQVAEKDDEVGKISVAPRQVELVVIDDPLGQPEQEVNFEHVSVKIEPAAQFSAVSS